MLKDLVNYFEEIELDDLTNELKSYGVEFISNENIYKNFFEFKKIFNARDYNVTLKEKFATTLIYNIKDTVVKDSNSDNKFENTNTEEAA